MLIEFSVENYLSFKEKKTISMEAANIRQLKNTNVFIDKDNDYKLLKTAAIYGANASGKSNLFKAMEFALDFIVMSAKDMQIGDEINVKPFLLSSVSAKKPSSFEFIFIADKKIYRYKFIADKKEVIKEELYIKKSKKQEERLFARSQKQIEFSSSFMSGSILEKISEEIKNNKFENTIRPNSLFLSVIAQFNGNIAKSILDWAKNFRIIYGGTNKNYDSTVDKLKDEKKLFLEILDIADCSIKDLLIKPSNLSNRRPFRSFHTHSLHNSIKTIKTIHSVFDEKDKTIEFDLNEQESLGTQRLIAMLGPIIETLSYGSILVIDELESNLHPLIIRFLVELFYSEKWNKKNAQLIFNTHNHYLLNSQILRRDQIWFTEKDKEERTDLYCLIDLKTPDGKAIRYDRVFYKDYLIGKYGAIPFIGRIKSSNTL